MKFNDKDIEGFQKELRQTEIYLRARGTEVITRKILEKRGYTVIRVDRYLENKLNNYPELFRDESQISALKQCVDISLDKKSKGLPDYFVCNEHEHFFLEVKSNYSKYNLSQEEVFPSVNKIIPIKIVHLFNTLYFKINNVTIEDYDSKSVKSLIDDPQVDYLLDCADMGPLSMKQKQYLERRKERVKQAKEKKKRKT
jgi:hypothetical protein